ncbi:MAG: DUF4376 domain-containing protein [Rhodocyclaceae bacterium]|nr:DUF4376 domain-containing protein [Rhodocyclaceae bacterium]
MKFYAVYQRDTGEIVGIASGSENVIVAPENSLEIDAPNRADGCYVDTTARPPALVRIPSRPTSWHEFDWTQKCWRLRADELRAHLMREADMEREIASTAPIDYTGKRMDADAVAQRNIQGKLAELREREITGAQLPVSDCIWRDYDNITHTWPDCASYQSWLSGLLVAIVERTTALYKAAWEKKAQIESMTDDDLLAAAAEAEVVQVE